MIFRGEASPNRTCSVRSSAMSVGTALLLFAGGAAAGFINTVAGGGSVITLPILTELAGASVANGTNRVAILVSNAVAAFGYNRGGAVPWPIVLPLVPAVILGAVGGAIVATSLSAEAMQTAIGVVLLLVALSVFIRPNRWLEGASTTWSRPISLLVFVGVGFYMGFVQAGVGFLLLAALVFGAGLDLVKANGAKVVLIFSATLIALVLFAQAGQVDFGLGLVMAAGNATGAYVSARLAVARGAGWVRWLLLLAALFAAGRLLLFS